MRSSVLDGTTGREREPIKALPGEKTNLIAERRQITIKEVDSESSRENERKRISQLIEPE